MLLIRFCQDNRIQIHLPHRNLQFTRRIGKNEFVAYIDGFGKLDGVRCLLEWKTSSSCYPEEPEGLLALDPQLVCYSWMTRISKVAEVVFVRKGQVEVQYRRAARGIRSIGAGHDPENRVRTVPSPQWDSFPAEPV